MFLQNVLQQRLSTIQNEEQQLNSKSIYSTGAAEHSNAADRQFAATNFQRTAVKLGSIRNGQLNYTSDQKYFEGHPSDQIRDGVHVIVKDVKDNIDKDLLGTKKPKWTDSVGVVGHPEPNDLKKTLKEIRTGMCDEKIQSTRAQEVYVGTDTRDVYHAGWNVSTEVINPRDSERFLQATREPVMGKTKMTSEKMLMQSMREQGKPYKTPEQLSSEISAQTAHEKEQTTDLRAELTQKVHYEKPRATKEAVNGIVTRMISNKLHDAEIADDPELTLKPDCKKTLKVVKEKQRYHNGKYEERKFETKGKKAWSCCQNKYEDSEGCVVKTVDKQRWTLTTYNEI